MVGCPETIPVQIAERRPPCQIQNRAPPGAYFRVRDPVRPRARASKAVTSRVPWRCSSSTTAASRTTRPIRPRRWSRRLSCPWRAASRASSTLTATRSRTAVRQQAGLGPDGSRGGGRSPAFQRPLLRRPATVRRHRRGMVPDAFALRPRATGADDARVDRCPGPRSRRQHAGLEQRPRSRGRNPRRHLPGQQLRRRRLLGDRRHRGRHEQHRGRVSWGRRPPGDFTIKVVASNINSDGVPTVGDDTDQDFALVCYNCAVEPGFTLSVDGADAGGLRPGRRRLEHRGPRGPGLHRSRDPDGDRRAGGRHHEFLGQPGHSDRIDHPDAERDRRRRARGLRPRRRGNVGHAQPRRPRSRCSS